MALVAQTEADERDALNDYIEAHVHGPLLLARVTQRARGNTTPRTVA